MCLNAHSHRHAVCRGQGRAGFASFRQAQTRTLSSHLGDIGPAWVEHIDDLCTHKRGQTRVGIELEKRALQTARKGRLACKGQQYRQMLRAERVGESLCMPRQPA